MLDDEKVNILVVDDLPEKLLVLETVLEPLGQDLITARSGRDALRRLLARDYAVILLDVNMPDMNGFETAEMIRSRRQTAQTPIIFITAFGDEIHTSRGYSLGAVDYILSPVVPEILRAKVSVFVDLYLKTRQVTRQAEQRIALVHEKAARAAAEEASRRSAFLAEASTVLMKALDYEATPRGLARVSVPFLGDLAAVTLLDRQGRPPRTELAWIDPGGGQSVHETTDGELGSCIGDAIGRVLETGSAEFCDDLPVPGPMGPRAISVIPGRLLDQLGPAYIVPLQARGRVFGAFSVVRLRDVARPDRLDRELIEDLAGRASIAIDNARLYRDIQEDDRRKNEFLAMLAHELRNPLAPIRNAAEILRRSGSRDAEEAWASNVIGRQVEQMVRLVDDLLDVSRISGGKIQLRKQVVEISEIIEHALEAVSPLMDARRHRLIVTRPEGPIHLEADKARLIQVLSNVLNNAAKYTADGGEIRLWAGRERDEAVFRVTDTGIGIPAEMLGRVFDLFTQVDRAIDRSQGGLGIGLTLVRRLVEKHGGTVLARSEGLGTGSEFEIRIPALPHAPNPGRAPAAPKAVGTNGQRRRVLVVDDNEDSARSLARLLRLGGHEVETCFDGASALNMASTFTPEFIFLDIGLPGMDGYEVARILRQQPAAGSLVLTALTGYGQEDDRRRSREAGFNHHLVKPVDLDSLIQIISTSQAR